MDLLFNDQLSAADFDAVVFVGFQVKPFVDEYQAVTRRVIDAFQTAGKPVAAICGGQQVLARLGYLDNHSAAYSAVASPGNLARPINWQRNQRVVTDGPSSPPAPGPTPSRSRTPWRRRWRESDVWRLNPGRGNPPLKLLAMARLHPPSRGRVTAVHPRPGRPPTPPSRRFIQHLTSPNHGVPSILNRIAGRGACGK